MSTELADLEQEVLTREEKLQEIMLINKEITFQNENSEWKSRDL